MRLFLISVVDFPEGDASSSYAALIVRGLRMHGVEAALVIPHASLIGNEATNHRRIGHASGVPFQYMSGIVNRSKKALAAYFDSARGMCASSLSIVRRKRRGRLDAVLLATPDTLEYLPVILACLFFRVPMVVLMVEMMTANKDLRGWRGNLRKIGYALSERVLPFVASGYVVISRILLDYYRTRISESRVHLMPILTDPDIAPTSQVSHHRKDKKLLLYSGTFSEKDGVDVLIEAFALLHRRYQDTVLILTGSSGRRMVFENLRSLARKLGVEANVEFRGFLPRQELTELQRTADVLLVCRAKTKFAEYGFPWKLGEYCMLRRPVVATRVGDIEHYFEDKVNIFLAEPGNANSIADRIGFVLDNYQQALAVAMNAREVAEREFHFANQGKKLADFLATIVGRGNQPIGSMSGVPLG